jgi:hypothetical protein
MGKFGLLAVGLKRNLMNPIVPEDIYKSRQVIEMLTVANEYCLFLEKCEEYSTEQVIDFLQKIAPLLYLKGALIPDVTESDPSANERFVIEEEWQRLFLNLQKKFGASDLFWVSSKEGMNEYSLTRRSLAEHLSDIYQDLKDFVTLYQKNRIAAKENAVAECRQLFQSHWGIRIIEIQRPIHNLLFGEEGENHFSDLLSSL